MAKDITVHKSFSLIEKFSKNNSAVAGSIANSKALCTQNGYIVYPSICMAIIGESGENKSQPIRWHSYA